MFKLSHFTTVTYEKGKAFVQNRDGNVSMLFGLALLPMIVAAGSAIDYSRASNAKASLQSALDATSLAMAKRAPILGDAQFSREAETFFKANLANSPELATLALNIKKTSKVLSVSANGEMQTAFMNIVGIKSIPIGSASETTIGVRKVEIALALDNTGSMGRLSKMDELKKATRNLISSAEASAPAGSGLIRMALVPFDTEVKVDPFVNRNRSWLVFKDGATDALFDDIRPRLSANASAWTGCIADRGPGFDTNTKRVDLSRKDSLFPGVACATTNLAPIQPLTDNWNALRAASDRMRPSGCTNITIGANFGMAALSPAEPIGAGVAFGTPDVDKYLIILTDGDNTKNRFLDRCSVGGSAAAIDTKTIAACDGIKRQSSKKDSRGNPIPDVKVFTIRVIEGNKALLENCASNSTMYREVSNAADIDKVFKDILREITQVKLTM